jgi:hypothetical protein
MTITVRCLDGKSYNLPYYKNMRAGQFVTQIVAPAVGCQVNNGDVYDGLVLNGAHAFTKDNKDKLLSDIMEDGATLRHTMCLGKIPPCLRGNGNLMPPTQHQLTLDPSGPSSNGGASPSDDSSSSNTHGDSPSACKKRRV